MSDALTQQLLSASFRGVSFNVRSEAQDSSGRKIVLHEYVNSPDRFVEDLGKRSPNFTIDAFVHGLDFLSRARQLEAALDLEGEALLTMPSLGTFKVKALQYEKRAAQTSIGEISYKLKFATGRPSAGPSVAKVDTPMVYSLADRSRGLIADNTAYVVPKTGFNIDTLASDISTTANSINDSVSDFISSTEIADLDVLVRTITRSSASLTQRIGDLNDLFVVNGSTKGIWQSVSLGSTGFNQLKSSFTRMIELTKFGVGSTFKSQSRAISNDQGIPVWPATTQQRIERNNNRISMVNQQRLNALLVSYEVAATREYGTQSEIDDATEQLENAHEDLMLDATDDILIVQSNSAVRISVEDVRFAALSVINQKKQKTTTTTTITLRATTSVFVEAYRQYSDGFQNSGELETQSMELRALNPDRPATALLGETTIFRT
jgi:prophage DNA circulation protein